LLAVETGNSLVGVTNLQTTL